MYILQLNTEKEAVHRFLMKYLPSLWHSIPWFITYPRSLSLNKRPEKSPTVCFRKNVEFEKDLTFKSDICFKHFRSLLKLESISSNWADLVWNHGSISLYASLDLRTVKLSMTFSNVLVIGTLSRWGSSFSFIKAKNTLFLVMIGCFASLFRYLVMARHRRLRVMSSTIILSLFPLSVPDASIFCFSMRKAGAFGMDFGGGGGTMIPLFRYSWSKNACKDAMFSWVRVTQYSEKSSHAYYVMYRLTFSIL